MFAAPPDDATEPIEPSRPSRFALHALLTYIGSILLVIFLGSLLQFCDLNLGLLITELALIALPAGLVLLLHRRTVDKTLFSVPQARQVSLAAVVAVCAIPIAVYKGIATRKALIGIDSSGQDPMSGVSVLLLVLLAPLCEELLFRPVIQSGLARHWSNRGAVLVTALLFALFHLNALRFAETFTLGLFIGIVYLKTRNFWCPVLVHGICNGLGPPLMRYSSQLGFLLNPAASVGLACLALAACYYLGERSSAPLNGLRQRLSWALFGSAMSLHATRSKSRPVALLTGGIVLCLVALIGFGHVSLMRQLAPPKFKSNYVVSEKDEWTVASPDEILARSEITITKFPDDYEDLILVLPFSNATLQQVNLVDEDVPFSRPESEREEYALDLSSRQEAARSGTLIVRWSFPLTCLTAHPKNGYMTALKSLAPSDSYALRVAVAEGSGFCPGSHPCYAGGLPRPAMEYGKCGLGLRREQSSNGPPAPSDGRRALPLPAAVPPHQTTGDRYK